MKSFSSLLLLLICSYWTKAQDTIIKLNDDKIICKVIEVGPTLTKYSTDSSELQIPNPNIKEIRYSDGKVDHPKYQNSAIASSSNVPTNKLELRNSRFYYNGKNITNQELEDILLNKQLPSAYHEFTVGENYRKLKYTGFTAIPIATLFGASALMIAAFGSDTETNLVVSCIGLVAITIPIQTIIFDTQKRKQYQKVVKLYNNFN